MGRHHIALGTRRVANIYIGQAPTPSAAKETQKGGEVFRGERKQTTDGKEVEEGWRGRRSESGWQKEKTRHSESVKAGLVQVGFRQSVVLF